MYLPAKLRQWLAEAIRILPRCGLLDRLPHCHQASTRATAPDETNSGARM